MVFGTLLIPFGIFAQKKDTVLYHKQIPNDVLSATLQPNKGEKQYITGDFIRQQGITRLSDAITYIDQTTFSSINHDRYAINLSATSTQHQQNVLLLVNGNKIELDHWDAININLLGISVNQIAYIEISYGPQIINGNFSGFGAINLVTRNDFYGLTVQAMVSTGSPIGYDARNAPNANYPQVDIKRNGLTHAQSLGYFGKRGHFNASLSYQDWFMRDTAVLSRSVFPGYTSRQTKQWTSRVESSFQLGNNLIDIGATYTSANDISYNPFYQLILPVQSYTQNISAKITHVFNANTYLKTGGNINHQQIDLVSNSNNVSPYYKFQYNMANAEFGKVFTKNKSLNLGYTINSYQLSNTKIKTTWHQPYASLKIKPNKKVTQQWDAVLCVIHHKVSPSLVFNHAKQNNLISSWNFSASYQNYYASQYPNLTLLTELNYYTSNTSLLYTPAHRLTADYYYKLNFAGNFRFTLHGGLRYSNNNTFIYSVDRPFWSTRPYPNDKNLGNSLSKVWGVNIHYNVLSNFWVDVDYYSANTQSNNVDFNQVLNQEAKRKCIITGGIKLPKKFELGIRSVATSKNAYPVYNANGEVFIQKMQAMYFTDVSLSRNLWADYLQVNASVKNIFNQNTQYLPFSANYNIRYVVTAYLKFDRLFKKSAKPKA